MCPDLAMTYRHGFFICAFLLCLTDGGLGQQRRGGGGSSSGSGASASQVVDFDCPEEFGYYPHPGDCTQYYVCVFGGALLESCTGGLMYSHELQTCDWPRNVGCGSGGAPEVQVVSTAKTQEPPPRQRAQQQISRQQQQQQQQQYVPQRPLQREEAIPKHHLYAEEELGPAEEVESDRQQRVYRGQPATLGQVARDRDGLSRHSNAIQITPSNGREKLSVISFGTQQQYRTDSETKRSSSEAKHRQKRQVKFSFPGDMRGFHQSASSNLGSWAASSPFPLPFPPPAPSWPPPPLHYSHDSGQYYNNKPNTPPLRNHVPTSQFSRPFRFPIKDNEDEFVPVTGKGVKLPKPSPELLITPSSVDKPNSISNYQQPPVLNTFLPLENQPDNYAFFNLETLPRNNGFNGTVHHVIVLSSNNTPPIIPSLFSVPSVGAVKSNIQQTASTVLNQTKIINTSLNQEEALNNNKAVGSNSLSIQKSTIKPLLNLISSASQSEESQLTPPISYHDNEKDGINQQISNKLNNKHNSKNKQKKSKVHETRGSGNVENSSYEELNHGDSEEDDNPSSEEEQDDHEEEEKMRKPNKHSSEDENYSTSNNESPSFPPPPKEFFGDPSKKYKNEKNPFSDPDFDFDKFFESLSDETNLRNKPSLNLKYHHSQESSQDQVNNFVKSRNTKRKQNQESVTVPYQISSEYHQTDQGPSTTSSGYESNIPKQHYESNRYITEPPHQVRGGSSLRKPTFVSHFPKNTNDGPLNVDSIRYSQSSEDDNVSYFNPRPTVNTPIVTKNTKVSGFLSKDHYNSSAQSVPRNHKYQHDFQIEHPTPLTLNFSSNFNRFMGDPRTTDSYSHTSPKYGSSNEEPTMYTVHKQNSLSNSPHETRSKYKDDHGTYDDEDYYGSNEEYDDYFDEELSLENLHSPNIKPVKPPDIPNKLKNIDSISFDKSKDDEEYDYTYNENEDERDYGSTNLHDDENDCSKKYKNHRCSDADKKYNEGHPTRGNDEDYEYDEKRKYEEDKPPNTIHYQVVEDIAESQHSIIKSNLKNNSKNILPARNVSPKNNIDPSNSPTSYKSSFETSQPIKLKNKYSLNNTQSQIIQNNISQKLKDNQITPDILLKALSADKGTTNRSVNRNLNKSKEKPFPKVTDTTLKQFPDQTEKQMTPDSTKLYFSSTSPLNPKSLKDFRQRPLTNLTPTGDIATSGTYDQPMTVHTVNSHLTNSLTHAGRQSIAPPPYVEPTTTTRVTGRGYNATQQQQYTPSPYDPYYNIYEDDSDLYKDIDYSQYQGQQYQSQPKPPVQQQVQAPPAPSPSRKPTLQYTPSPPPPQSYNAVQQDVYNQAQDYSDNYNLQDEDIDYKQADIDVKGNRSRTAKRQDPAKSAVGKGSEKQDQTNVSPNRRLTLTASFSFDNDKTPVTSSRKFETNPRQRSNVNSFQVEDPPSSGPERDTHELVLSYIRQENSAVKTESKETKPNTYALNTETLQIEPSFKDNPNRYTYYLDDLETSEISTTAFPKKSDSSSNELRTVRPFRIIVPSSTEKPSDSATTEETSSRPRFTMRRGNKHFEDTSEHSTTTNSIDGTVKPYKLPPLSRETIEMSLQKSRLKALQTLERKSEEKENEETRRRINQVYNKQAEKSSDENPSESSKNDGSGHLRNNKINYSQELPNVQLPERHSHATRNKYETNEKTTEESSANEQTPLTVDSSPSTGRRYSNRLITTPYIEESDVKLIEIKPVSRRFQNEEKLSEDDTYNKNTLKDLFSTPVSILQHSYQVTEENLDLEKSTPSYVPLSRRFQPKKPASEVKESVNSSFTKESVPLVNLQANGELSKSPLIRSQSTEKSAQKSLYSLRFDNNGGNLKGNVDGHVLATLEAITVSPENPDKTVRTLANTSESQFKNEKDIKHESDRLSDHNNFARSNQIRMRSQSRIYSQQNNQNSRDYQFIPNESTSTESSDKDTAFVPVRSQGGYRTSASTESPITIETPQTNHVNEENVSVSVRSQSHHRTPITTESSNKNEAPQTRYDNDKNSFVPVRTQSLYRTSTSSESPNGNETPQISYDNDRNAFVQVRTQSYFRTPGSSESQIKIETHQASYDDVKNAFVPVRTQSHYRTPTTTESQIRNTTPQATEQKRVTEETPKIENRNTLSYPSTNFEDFEINQNRNQPGRRLRYRNRLETETEDEENDPENSDRSVSDEGSEYSIQRKSENRVKLGEEGGNEKPNSSPNYDDFQFTPARQFFKTTSSNNNDDVTTDEGSEDIQEAIKRRQNMRRMQIRKKIRITTEQPETSSTDLTETTPTTIRSVRFQYLSQVKYSQKSPAESEVLGEDIGKLNQPEAVSRDQSDFNSSYKKETNSNSHSNREFNQNTHERGRVHFEPKESSLLKSNVVPLVVDPYTLISTSLSSERALNRTTLYQQTTTTPRNNLRVNRLEIKSSSLTEPQLAAELNSYFRKEVQNFTNSSSVESTTPYSMTTVEKIRDKFRLGSFPKPLPSSNSYGRKPSVEDNTPPPLLSDKCSQELDSDPECGEKPLIRVRPTSTSSESQSTPGLTRGSSRNRGSATYTVSPNEAEPPPRGTPSSLSRNRPTLKPSTSIVSKASEFVDIYRYPPSRPEPIYPTPQVDKTAAKCRKDVCLLPDCSCGGKEIPGDLPVEETPQIVLLTFDDSVNDLNKGLYSDLFEKGRTNPNGCPISATFYVSHEWTDYSQVQNLYASGHEIASHSVSHSFGEQFSVKKWTKEIAGQREILSAYGGVRQEDIRGMRAPFLAIGGNKMFKMLYDSNFTYDSSMPVYENRPPSWPYTLDYKIFHDCMIPPCPTRSYPGVWEVPMVMWQDLNGGRCSMGDACSNPPTADGVYKMLVKNFERHFTSNRSPFGLFYHAAWFTQPHHKEGFIAFLDTITKMPEVWLVTNWQAIQWVRDPTPISRLNSFAPFGCNYPERPRKCMNPKVCNLWHKSGVRYMRTCQPCPDIYPWTGKTGVRNSRVDNEIITE